MQATQVAQHNEDDLKLKKQQALVLWKQQEDLKYRLALQWYHAKGGSRAWLLWPWNEIYKQHKAERRTITSIFSGLYLGEPGKTWHGRYFGLLTLGFLAGAMAVAALKGATSFAILLTSVSTGLLTLGSAFYLGEATYEYFKTPEAKRTALQKFNMLSSVPSTLLVFGLTAAAICASLALPGALFAVAAVAGTWLLYKAWQGQKGYSLAQKEEEKKISEINQINSELDNLRKDPEIDKALKIIQAQSELKRLNAIGKVHGHRDWHNQVLRVEAELKLLRKEAGELENSQADAESEDRQAPAAIERTSVAEKPKLSASPNSLFATERRLSQDESASLLAKP